MFRLIKPILKELRKTQLLVPAPYVEVTKQAEDEFMADIRSEMKKKVWEKDGGVVSILPSLSERACRNETIERDTHFFYLFQSWYVDPKTGLCHVSLRHEAVCWGNPCSRAHSPRFFVFVTQTLYPYSQINFWRRCTFMRLSDKFVWTGV